MIAFDHKHIRLLICLLALFAVGVSFTIHRYSLGVWSLILESEDTHTILGGSRWIRSDDWAVEIPLMIAQLYHTPKFPNINKNIGPGTNMLTHSKVPVHDWLIAFRPGAWGFLAGADFGLAWMWWFMELGLFYSFFLFFMMITRNEFVLSVCGSLLIVFSIFFQSWSLHKSEIVIFAMIVFVSFFHLLKATTIRTIAIQSCVLGWSLCCFAIHFIYPPFQLICAYFLLFASAGYFFANCKHDGFLQQWPQKTVGIAGALFLLAVALGCFYSSTHDAIELMVQSDYPGNRFSTGGDYPFWLLLSSNFFTLLNDNSLNEIPWHLLGNECEASSFVTLFLPLLGAYFTKILISKKRPDAFSTSIVIYVIGVALYMCIGIPADISRYSLMNIVPGKRAVLGFGIGGIVLLVHYIARKESVDTLSRLVIGGVFAAVMFLSGMMLGTKIGTMSLLFLSVGSIAWGVAALFILDGRNGKTVLVIMTILAIHSSFFINPVAQGGTQVIQQNRISKKMIEIDRSLNGESVWGFVGDWYYGNLFRMLGLKSIGGTHTYPHPEFWSNFDPQKEYLHAYNRFAHISFKPHRFDKFSFISPWPDQCWVGFNPNSRMIREIGVSHMLVIGEDRSHFENNLYFRRLYRDGDKSIYAVVD